MVASVHVLEPAPHALPSEVLDTLSRMRRAQVAALALPRLGTVDEQRFSAVYIGVVDLEQRLRAVAGLCLDLPLAELTRVQDDLQSRGWVAAALLEALTESHQPGRSSEENDRTARRVAALGRAYGAALFA